MKTTELEPWDIYLGNCPYCDSDIEQLWGRLGDYTITDPGDGNEWECEKCNKPFKIKIVSSIG